MLSSLIRTLSFFSKWFAELVREPTLMLSLVLGPFLVLFLFGVGTRIGDIPKPRTIVVLPPEQQSQGILGVAPQDISEYLTIVGTTTDRRQALDGLARGQADLAVVLPPDPERRIAGGQRATLEIVTAEIDPLKDSYARAYLAYQIGALNQRVVQRTISEAQASSGAIRDFVTRARPRLAQLRQLRDDAAAARQELAALKAEIAPVVVTVNEAIAIVEGFGGLFGPALADQLAPLHQLAHALTALDQGIDRLDQRLAATGASGLPTAAEVDQLDQQLTVVDQAAAQLSVVPPEVLSAPFELRLSSIAPFALSALAFYAPAVLALLLQHLAVTLGALSLARVRLLGPMELLQTSPVRPTEVVVGNYLSYSTLCLLAGSALVALLALALQVPILGSPVTFAATLVLLVLASLGIGFIISLLASSEQQAAQLAMLVLIASVFFSGFLIFLESIDWPVRGLAYLLPATYAIRTLRDVMLRGGAMTPSDLLILGAMAGLFFVLTIGLFRREFRPR
jgi:ABC-2 type transport system permease protein